MPGSGANPPSPIGQAGELHASKAGDGKLQSIEEWFEGRHFDCDVFARMARSSLSCLFLRRRRTSSSR